jgi:hypothetical protein
LAGSIASLLSARPLRNIDMDKVNALLAALPERPDCSLYEQQLDAITMDDMRIRRVLLTIAKIDSSIIHSPAIYRDLTRQRKVTKEIAGRVVEDMIGMPTSPFEVRGRSLDTVSFSFRDPNFKRYILMRNAGL